MTKRKIGFCAAAILIGGIVLSACAAGEVQTVVVTQIVEGEVVTQIVEVTAEPGGGGQEFPEATDEPGEPPIGPLPTPTAETGPATTSVRQLPGLPASGRIGAVLDPVGRETRFAADQVIFHTGTPGADLDGFLERYDGTILDDGTLPAASSIIRTGIRRVPPFEYVLVQVELDRANRTAITTNMEALGMRGAYTFSSNDALALTAILTEAQLDGYPVTPNFALSLPMRIPSSSSDEGESASGGRVDAFTLGYMQMTGITRAWQLVDALEVDEEVRVAVIDSGFAPGLPDYENPDFPPPDEIAQYDVSEDDPDASGPGGVALWHGTEVASIVGAVPDNSFGTAGTGGQVVSLQMIRVNDDDGHMSWFHVSKAIHLAVSLGADVINLSVAGECGSWCRTLGGISGLSAAVEAINLANENGVVVVAAAGNGGSDSKGDSLDQTPVLPCGLDHVICVAALAPGTGAAGMYSPRTDRASYSNYGNAVDVWSPGSVRCTVLPDEEQAKACHGTSAAAPFVSGTIALMLAVNPDLTPDDILEILQDTRWEGGTDPLVDTQGILGAYNAVLAAAGGQLPTDRHEPNEAASSARSLTLTNSTTTLAGLTLHRAGDVDAFSIRLTSRTSFTIRVRHAHTLADLTLSLLDSDGDSVGATDFIGWLDSNLGYDEEIIEARNLSAGQYVIIVRAAKASDVTVYDLVIER